MEQYTIPSEEPETSQEPKEVSMARAFGGQSLLRDIVETFVLTLIIFLIVNTLTGRFQVRGTSMDPSLHSSQYLVVSKLSYWLGEPRRGDIIVFEPPNGSEDDYIKRIVGLPGEKVEIREGVIWINGYRLDEPYLNTHTPHIGTWELGPDQYFVLGDNRPNSSDSHTWGPLARESIVGKAWLCYWPPKYWGLVPNYRFPDIQERE